MAKWAVHRWDKSIRSAIWEGDRWVGEILNDDADRVVAEHNALDGIANAAAIPMVIAWARRIVEIGSHQKYKPNIVFLPVDIAVLENALAHLDAIPEEGL